MKLLRNFIFPIGLVHFLARHARRQATQLANSVKTKNRSAHWRRLRPIFRPVRFPALLQLLSKAFVTRTGSEAIEMAVLT